MSSLSSFFERPGAALLLFFALLLVIGQTAAFLLSLQEKKSGKQKWIAALHLLLGFLLFVILLDGYDNAVFFRNDSQERLQFRCFAYSLPWLGWAACEALSAAVLTVCFREYRRYKKSTVTPAAIRQTLDLLPEGICVSTPEGTVLLANLQMNALCRELTGERLSDVRKLRDALERRGEDQDGKRLIHSSQGEVWLFSSETIGIDGKDYERTGAVLVTERYRITEELREKNAHLHDIQRRMKEAAELSGRMFVKQEEARARSALHNELGQVLLMGRHTIEHPESTDRAMVALMTGQMNRFLLGESRAVKPEREDELSLSIRMAGSIGVNVALQGETPKDQLLRSLLAQAIRECAANAVKHAEGTALDVMICEESAGPRSPEQDVEGAQKRNLIVAIANNGKPPKSPVVESGGLLSLRRSVEAAGGEMRVQSLPRFYLSLRFPGR